MYRSKWVKMGLIVMLSFVIILSGCNKVEIDETKNQKIKKINIYTTLYVLEEFGKKIGGENVNVINLVPPGVSEHDFEPSAKQIIELTKSDIFIYNGAGIETWIKKILTNLKDTKVMAINASEGISLIEGRHDHDDEQQAHEESINKDETDVIYDSHVWLNPRDAMKLADNIKKALVIADPVNSSLYEENYKVLKQELVNLDQKFALELENTKRKDFFVSHGVFGYLAKRYNLEQNAISGIMPSNEPSPAELTRLIKKAQELEIKYILLDPKDVNKISEVVAEEIGAKVAIINTLSSLSTEEAEQGIDYFTLMEKNLVALKKALNE